MSSVQYSRLPFTYHVAPSRQTETPKTSVRHANFIYPICTVYPWLLSSHTPTPSFQIPLSSLSTLKPPHIPSRPGPTWQLAPPVRLCAHPPSQHIRLAFPMEEERGWLCHWTTEVTQCLQLAARLKDPQPLAPASSCIPLLPTTSIQQILGDVINK